MLRKIRIILALLFFLSITLLFLDFTGTIHQWFGWMAKIQFLPAILALNAGIIFLLVALTFAFGRIYCSVICPLGVFQDILSRTNGWRKKKKYRFSYSPPMPGLRYGVLGLFVLAIIAGIGSFTALLAPYSSYGRIAQDLLAPFWQWSNNLLAYFAERIDSYAFYETEVWIKSIPTFVIAVITFIILAILSRRNGRTYCNTICPVGTVLGCISRYSLLRPIIDIEKCNNCNLCSRTCKAACIDSKNHRIDYSRCVTCMDCVDTCKQKAISYRFRSEKEKTKQIKEPENYIPKTNKDRRNFLTGLGLFITAVTAKAQEKKIDGGLAVILDKKIPDRTTPIVPPGAQGLRNMSTHCTGCQLCISVCPNSVLRPSAKLKTLMQPEMSYERGYCRPECTKCSEVCPTRAIHPVTRADKSSIQIGHAVWVKENCIPLTDKVNCGNCARHCPTGAITMILSDSSATNSPKIPIINTERCIGCGACENLCPSRPFSAIYVEGHERHRNI